ncbi:MAG: HEAT repeat domain-containing protein [Planctomycetes bacterium]|nr:HEAT repeat domain-containing protein [Planctomycetota bacterium]
MSAATPLLIGIGLVVFGLGMSLWGFFVRGRSRRRARCPGCWYSMVGTPAQGTKHICPECGHAIEGTRYLYRTRRHWRVVFLGLTLVLSGLALGSIAMAGGKPWQRFVPASILVFLVDPDDVGSGVADATWDELRTRATYDQLSAWQRRRLANAIARTLKERDVPSRLAALEMLDDLNPPRSVVLSGVLAGLLRDGPTPGPPPVKYVLGETYTIMTHPPRPEHFRHDDLVVRLLGRVGTSADVSVLVDVLKSRPWRQQHREARRALATLNDPSAVGPLCDSWDKQIWSEIIVSVALFGDRGGARAEQLIEDARAQVFPRFIPFLDACSNVIAGKSAHVSIALSEVLRRDADAGSHYYVFETLKKLGPEAELAVPTLIELLGSESAEERYRAASVLGSIGPGARQALPDLARLVEDPEVSRTALWAIDRIRRPD